MEELLSSVPTKPFFLHRGELIEGEIVSIGDKEVVLDLGTKSEGLISKKDFTEDQKSKLKIGDKLKAYVIEFENDSGMVIMSFNQGKQVTQSRNSQDRERSSFKTSPVWNKLNQSKNQNNKITVNIIELNKGGLIAEFEGVRGFLPSSQIGDETIKLLIVSPRAELTGLDILVNVIEVDQSSNRLIFSQKVTQSPVNLDAYQENQKLTGEILAVLPFGLLIKIEPNTGGLVLSSEAAWEKVEDLNNLFKVGQQVETVVVNKEKELGRLNLSIRKAAEDPFTKIAEKFQADDVISGVVSAVNPTGISFTLSEGVEGFMPSNKQEAGIDYEIGKKISLLVDSVDANKRRVNVAPFLTTTKGLIYK